MGLSGLMLVDKRGGIPESSTIFVVSMLERHVIYSSLRHSTSLPVPYFAFRLSFTLRAMIRRTGAILSSRQG